MHNPRDCKELNDSRYLEQLKKNSLTTYKVHLIAFIIFTIIAIRN